MPNQVTVILRTARVVLDHMISPSSEFDFHRADSPGHEVSEELRRERWGTPENAKSVVSDPAVVARHCGVEYYSESDSWNSRIMFQSVYSFPWEVLISLSRRFPYIPIQAVYADEDLRSNYGFVEFLGGEVLQGAFEPFGVGTVESLRFSSTVVDGKPW